MQNLPSGFNHQLLKLQSKSDDTFSRVELNYYTRKLLQESKIWFLAEKSMMMILRNEYWGEKHKLSFPQLCIYLFESKKEMV